MTWPGYHVISNLAISRFSHIRYYMIRKPCNINFTQHASHVESKMAVFQYSILHGSKPCKIEYTWWFLMYIQYYMIRKPCNIEYPKFRFPNIRYYMVRCHVISILHGFWPCNIEYERRFLILHGKMPCKIEYILNMSMLTALQLRSQICPRHLVVIS